MQREEILRFVGQRTVGFPLLGVLQVGSTARGHALVNSDIDLMAFYDSGSTMASYPLHELFDGHRLTLEHHDLATFREETNDYRFNLGSVRQLHKVRDAIVLIASDSLDALIASAHEAHLDRTVLLHAVARLATQWKALTGLDPALRDSALVGWTELLATLDVMSRPRVTAYSKPKWLYRTLRGAALHHAIEALDGLDPPTSERIESVTAALDRAAARWRPLMAPEPYVILVETALNDARSMLLSAPADSLPAARFAASQLCRAFYRLAPQDCFAQNTRIDDADLAGILTPNIDSVDRSVAQMAYYLRTITAALTGEFSHRVSTRVGTTRFFTHFLATYASDDLLPACSLETLKIWLATATETFCA